MFHPTPDSVIPCDARTNIGSEVASSSSILSPSFADVFCTILSPASAEPSVLFSINPSNNSNVPVLSGSATVLSAVG